MRQNNQDVVYGIHGASELLAKDPQRIDRVYFQKDLSKRQFELMKQCRKLRIPTQSVPQRKLSDLALTDKHQGVVIRCGFKPYDDERKVFDSLGGSTSPGLILVPASVEDPHNLGAITRSCVAFGVSAIFVERHNTSGLNATVSKASAGMLEHMPVCRPRSLEATMKQCLEKGYRLVGAVAGAERQPHEMDFSLPTVIIVGGEHRAIPPYLNKLLTDKVGIPIDSRVPSLNVSVAAAILLYECNRQRGGKKMAQS